MCAKSYRSKKRGKKVVNSGIINILATMNNTMVTVCDNNGNVLTWSSAGNKGFKGSKRSTPFAAQIAAEDAAKKAFSMGMKSCAIVISGPGSGRESAIRAVSTVGIKVHMIKDVTPIPHNGCRPPKRRRV